MLGYGHAIRARTERRRFRPEDPLRMEVEDTFNALQKLTMDLRDLADDRAVERGVRRLAAGAGQERLLRQDTYADDLLVLTKHLDLKNAIHVGHSGGGEVAGHIGRHGAGRADLRVLHNVCGNCNVGPLSEGCRFDHPNVSEIPALLALASRQSEPAFLLTQVVPLAVFLMLGLLRAITFRGVVTAKVV